MAAHPELDAILAEVRLLAANYEGDVWDGLHTALDAVKDARAKALVKANTDAAHRGGEGDIAVIGMGPMGQNLILNMADRGFKVVAWNRPVEKEAVERFVKDAGRDEVVGAESTADMCQKLKSPRKVFLMVRAGPPVDYFIDQLVPHLQAGDIIIDGGNSHFPDTIRRAQHLRRFGIHFVGAGVSGGEEGARHGPSIMPSGPREAWEEVAPILQAISAKVDGDPCCQLVGGDGAGHYVKMVHNGIEYGDMQIICEAYHFMRDGLGMAHDAMAQVFEGYNRGDLESYLIEITASILSHRTPSGEVLVELIRDTAGQKGTGAWTGIEALELGIPLTLVGEAVFARSLSARKEERVAASKVIPSVATRPARQPREAMVEKLGKALLAAKIVSYAQGFMLLREAAAKHGWDLDYGAIALMWRGGCIIRSTFLGQIKHAFDVNPSLVSLLVDEWFRGKIADCEAAWRDVVAEAAHTGIPVPCLSTALSFWDGYRTARLPANLLQAQRDFFGAHTFELLSAPGVPVHETWTAHRTP